MFMINHRILTPPEARQNNLASLAPEIRAARERLNKAIQRSGGAKFVFNIEGVPIEVLRVVNLEMAEAGWIICGVIGKNHECYEIQPI